MNEEEYEKYLDSRDRERFNKRLNFYQNLANDEISRIVTGLFGSSSIIKTEEEDAKETKD